MGALFRGWKRKVGVVTLATAMLSIAIWVRSEKTITTITFDPDEGPRHVFSASPQGLTWLSRQGAGQYVFGDEFLNLGWQFTPIDDDEPEPNDFEGWHVSWNWIHGGFHFGEYSSRAESQTGEVRLSLIFGTVRIWRIPHWTAALPVTLLSAWLLLSKQPANLPVEPQKDQP